MKKILWLLLILILTACNSQADIACPEEKIAFLEEEQNRLLDTINEKNRTITDLNNLIADLEEKLSPQIPNDKILDSFMENLSNAAELLGVDKLDIPRENVTVQGNFVTAYFNDVEIIRRYFTTHHRVELIFQYQSLGEEIQWTLLYYNIGGIGSPGILDNGRGPWQWGQEELFAESFIVRFYPLIDWWGIYKEIKYFEEEIMPANWREQVIRHMHTHNNIRIADLWYEESRLMVDLTPAATIFFNWGSSGGYSHVRALIDSLATMPNVTEIEVLVGGQRGIEASHFSFVGVFRVN